MVGSPTKSLVAKLQGVKLNQATVERLSNALANMRGVEEQADPPKSKVGR